MLIWTWLFAIFRFLFWKCMQILYPILLGCLHLRNQSNSVRIRQTSCLVSDLTPACTLRRIAGRKLFMKNRKMTHVCLTTSDRATGLTDRYSCFLRSPWVRCCKSLGSFWASSCWCYSPSPSDSPSFMERTRKTQTKVHKATARAYSASNRATMHSTRTGQPQSVTLCCDDNNDECAECLLRDVRDHNTGLIKFWFINSKISRLFGVYCEMHLTDSFFCFTGLWGPATPCSGTSSPWHTSHSSSPASATQRSCALSWAPWSSAPTTLWWLLCWPSCWWPCSIKASDKLL